MMKGSVTAINAYKTVTVVKAFIFIFTSTMRAITKFVILALLVLTLVAAIDAAKKAKARAKAPARARARAPVRGKAKASAKGKAPPRGTRIQGVAKPAVKAQKTNYDLQWAIAEEIRGAMGGTLWEPPRGWKKDKRGCPTPVTCKGGDNKFHNGVMYPTWAVACMVAAGYGIQPCTVCVSAQITWSQRPGTYLHEAFHLYMYRLVNNSWISPGHEAVAQEGSYFNEGFNNALTMEYSLRRGAGKPWMHLSGIYGQWKWWTPLAQQVLDTWDPVNPQWNTRNVPAKK